MARPQRWGSLSHPKAPCLLCEMASYHHSKTSQKAGSLSAVFKRAPDTDSHLNYKETLQTIPKPYQTSYLTYSLHAVSLGPLPLSLQHRLCWRSAKSFRIPTKTKSMPFCFTPCASSLGSAACCAKCQYHGVIWGLGFRSRAKEHGNYYNGLYKRSLLYGECLKAGAPYNPTGIIKGTGPSYSA